MIVCPICYYPVTLANAIEVMVDRGGVRGERVTCPTCGTIFTSTIVIVEPSPLSIEQLKEVLNQPRG